MSNIAFPPLTHSVTVAVKGVGNLLVGGLLGLCGTQDDPTTQDHRLRRGSSTDQSVERIALLGGKIHGGSKRAGHWRRPAAFRLGEDTVYANSRITVQPTGGGLAKRSSSDPIFRVTSVGVEPTRLAAAGSQPTLATSYSTRSFLESGIGSQESEKPRANCSTSDS